MIEKTISQRVREQLNVLVLLNHSIKKAYYLRILLFPVINVKSKYRFKSIKTF